MKLLLTTDVVGGVWDFALTLSRALVRRHAAEVTLLALGEPSPAQRERAAATGATLLSEPLKLEWMQDAEADVTATRRFVERLVRELRPDVVHANQFAAACLEVDAPVVLTLHSDVLSWRRRTLGADGVPDELRAYAALVREALARADTIVSVSRFLAAEVRGLYGFGGSIDVVYNGWPAPEAVPGGPRERVSVLAGRVWDAAKNVALAAEAARGWDAGGVLLAGETQHPEGGVASVPAPLRPLGFLDRTALDQVLGRAAVYVSPARYDPFGLLPLQAALHGCALLLSDIPSYRELWQDAAVFFRADDADDLRRHWQRLLDKPGEMAARARQRAVDRFSEARMADAYASLYERVPA